VTGKIGDDIKKDTEVSIALSNQAHR